MKGYIYRGESYRGNVDVKDPYFFRFLVEGAYKDGSCSIFVSLLWHVCYYMYIYIHVFVFCLFCNSSIRKCSTCELFVIDIQVDKLIYRWRRNVVIFFVSRFFCIRNDNNYEVSYHVQKIYQSIYFYFNFLRRWINRLRNGYRLWRFVFGMQFIRLFLLSS